MGRALPSHFLQIAKRSIGGCLLKLFVDELHIDIILVDSNDKLYGADKKFIAEAVKIVDTILKEILEELKEVGEQVK